MVQLGKQNATPTAPTDEKVASEGGGETGRVRREAGLRFAFFGAVLLASVLLPMPAANGEIAHVPAFCPFYRLTGLPCPGCGLTRAFVCIGHGQFAQSLHWHPIGWLVYALFVAAWMYSGATLIRGRPTPAIPARTQAVLCWGALAVLLLAGIARIGWLIATHTHYV